MPKQDNQTTDSNQTGSVSFGKIMRVDPPDPERLNKVFRQTKLKRNPKLPKPRKDF